MFDVNEDFQAKIVELRQELLVYEMGWQEEEGTVSDVEIAKADIAELERCIAIRRKRNG